MGDPLDKATSQPPATLGEGCLSRYDPEAMDEEDGTDFPGAEALWRSVMEPPGDPDPIVSGRTDKTP